MATTKARIRNIEEAIGLELDDKKETNRIQLTFISEKGERRVETFTRKEIDDLISEVYGTHCKNDKNGNNQSTG